MSKTVGAPSQHSQPSRKGKKAWRKNVNIGEIEQGLESLRDEERLTGAQLHKKANDELFEIDLKGDEKLKRVLPKYDHSQLMSSKLLAQRSAIPAVFSRASKKPSSSITREEKGRLLRLGKRAVKGPFNAVVDPRELGAGSALLQPTEAVKKSGTYDVWADTDESTHNAIIRKGKGKYQDPKAFLIPLIKPPTVKAPETFHPHRSIDLPAIVQPHQGTSYNPLESAHRELILSAYEIEQRREAEGAKFKRIKERMDAARCTVADEAEQGAPGMHIDNGDPVEGDKSDVDEIQDNIVPTSKIPPPKTQKQRRKAARVLEEKRLLLDRRRHRRFLAAVSSAKSWRTQIAGSLRARQAALDARRATRAQILKRRGLAGKRLGKHVVQEGQVDVQLGEELSESLRQLKPQGNLFRDRFLSLQHRALIEPRVPVLPQRHKTKIKEYEKHAWKRFE